MYIWDIRLKEQTSALIIAYLFINFSYQYFKKPTVYSHWRYMYQNYCFLVFSLVCFHPDSKVLQLFSASDDCKIRIWDLSESR